MCLRANIALDPPVSAGEQGELQLPNQDPDINQMPDMMPPKHQGSHFYPPSETVQGFMQPIDALSSSLYALSSSITALSDSVDALSGSHSNIYQQCTGPPYALQGQPTGSGLTFPFAPHRSGSKIAHFVGLGPSGNSIGALASHNANANQAPGLFEGSFPIDIDQGIESNQDIQPFNWPIDEQLVLDTQYSFPLASSPDYSSMTITPITFQSYPTIPPLDFTDVLFSHTNQSQPLASGPPSVSLANSDSSRKLLGRDEVTTGSKRRREISSEPFEPPPKAVVRMKVRRPRYFLIGSTLTFDRTQSARNLSR